MLLPDWSAHVTLFTNGVVAPDAEQRAALHSRGVRIEEASVQALEGAAPTLDGVRLEDGRLIAIDALFITPRTRVASPLAEQLGCAFDDGPSGSFVRTDARRETTVPGVYCAGDAARASHNATWAASDGVTAGISVHQSLIAAPKP
jgi:thioredoxin reductase